MRKMKDSGIEWIGEIPESWGIVPLSKLSKRMNNGYVGPTRGLFVDDGVRYLQSLHIKNGEIFFEKSPYYVTEDWAKEHSTGTVHTNDVLIVQTGDIGQIAYVSNEFDGCNCHALIIVTPQEQICQGEYLSFLLQGHYAHHQLQMRKTGALHPHLNCGDIKDIKLPIPPLEIQTKLVSYMKDKTWEIDSIIAAKEKTNELLKERRQSIIYEAVTKGLDPTVPMKDSGIEWIGEIPESWDVKKIKHIGSYRNGLTYSPNDIVGENEGTLVLRSSNIQNGRLVFDDNVFVSCNIPEQLKVHKGDVLICSRNGSRELIGKNAIIDIDDDLSFGAFIMIFRCHNPKYMSYILNSNIFTYYLSTFLTATVNKLTGENFGNRKIVYCSDAPEQKNLVEFLDKKCKEIDILISSNNSTIEKLKEYRQSVIYEAVTGKIEV